MNMTCQEAATYFEVPTGGLNNLNNDLNCLTLINRTICAPLSCPITVIDVNASIIHVTEWVDQYGNFTLTQFLTWNPYIGLPVMANGDTVCSGSVVNFSIYLASADVNSLLVLPVVSMYPLWQRLRQLSSPLQLLPPPLSHLELTRIVDCTTLFKVEMTAP